MEQSNQHDREPGGGDHGRSVGAAASPFERLRTRSASLTGAERRVATAIGDDPSLAAFGTVADVAAAAGAGAATVVRFATKLGYDGFSDLQAAVRTDVVGRLRPAVERIRSQPGGDRLAAHLATEVENVQRTLAGLDGTTVRRAAHRLADRTTPVAVIAGDASTGVAAQFVAELSVLRDGVRVLGGDPVALARDLALAPRPTTLVAIDLHRYDRWVVETVRAAGRADWPVVALTDGPLSPIATVAGEVFVVAAGTIGPFDSQIGIVSVLQLLVAEVAAILAHDAVDRLDAVERAWSDADALTDR